MPTLEEFRHLSQLFSLYDDRDSELAAAKKAVDTAMVARSEVLQEIVDTYGVGPYKRGGRQVKIVKRGSTYFLRGPGNAEAVEVG